MFFFYQQPTCFKTVWQQCMLNKLFNLPRSSKLSKALQQADSCTTQIAVALEKLEFWRFTQIKMYNEPEKLLILGWSVFRLTLCNLKQAGWCDQWVGKHSCLCRYAVDNLVCCRFCHHKVSTWLLLFVRGIASTLRLPFIHISCGLQRSITGITTHLCLHLSLSTTWLKSSLR